MASPIKEEPLISSKNNQRKETKTSTTLFNRKTLKQNSKISTKYNELIAKYGIENCEYIEHKAWTISSFSILASISRIKVDKTTKIVKF